MYSHREELQNDYFAVPMHIEEPSDASTKPVLLKAHDDEEELSLEEVRAKWYKSSCKEVPSEVDNNQQVLEESKEDEKQSNLGRSPPLVTCETFKPS